MTKLEWHDFGLKKASKNSIRHPCLNRYHFYGSQILFSNYNFKGLEFIISISACFLNKRFKKSSLFPIPHLDVFKWAVRYEHNDGFRWAARWPFSCSLGLSNSYLRVVFWFTYDSCKSLAHEVSLYFPSAWVVFT